MNETMKTVSNPILIPGINRATITMLSEQYGIPYRRIVNHINYVSRLDKNHYDVIYPKSKSEFEDMLAKDIQFVCKADKGGAVGYLFTNAAFASIKFKKTPLISGNNIPEIVKMCSEDHRGRKPGTIVKSKKTNVEPQPEPKIAEPSDLAFESKEEEELLINFAKAYKSGEIMNLLAAALALDSYRRREIAELKNSASGNGISWTSSSSAEKVISVLATALQQPKYQTWCRVYDCLMNDYNMDLRARNKKPLINGLKENEWHLFYQAVSDICKSKYIDLRLVLDDAGIDANGLSIAIHM